MEKKLYVLVDGDGGSYQEKVMEGNEAEGCNERVSRYGFKWVPKEETLPDPNRSVEFLQCM